MNWSPSSIPQDQAAVAIIKHANPCGVAVGADPVSAYKRALECDPTSAFGGIVALNRTLDAETASEILKVFTEVVIAPDATDEAVALCSRPRRTCACWSPAACPIRASRAGVYRSVAGGFLMQTRDVSHITAADLKIVTKRQPTEAEVADMLFAFTIGKHVKSNAIVLARGGQTLGIGAGQMNRKDSRPHRRHPRRRLQSRPEGLGLRVRSLLPLRRRADPGGGGGRHGGDPARWLHPRRRSDRSRRRARPGDGVHRRAGVPALGSIHFAKTCSWHPSSACMKRRGMERTRLGEERNVW